MMNKKLALALLSLVTLIGCSTNVQNPEDPYESFNRVSFKINDGVDKVLLEPLAKAYVFVIPELMRKGINNSISNVNNIPILANDLAQFKLKGAAESASRFVFNTTFGMLGLIDLTKPFGLPQAHSNDVGMTLAAYGWKQSDFFVLPFLGPATVRDGIGRIGDAFLLPQSSYISNVRLRNVSYGLRIINARANLIKLDKATNNVSFDSYIFQRESYIQYRDNQLIRAGLIQSNVDKPVSVKDILEESGG